MSTRGDMPDAADDRLLCVVIATGMFIAAGPAVLQLLWLAALVVGTLLWRQHLQRTAAHERKQSQRGALARGHALGPRRHSITEIRCSWVNRAGGGAVQLAA